MSVSVGCVLRVVDLEICSFFLSLFGGVSVKVGDFSIIFSPVGCLSFLSVCGTKSFLFVHKVKVIT